MRQSEGILGLAAILGICCGSLAWPAAPDGQSPEHLLEEAAREYRSALDAADRDARLAGFRRAEMLFARLIGGDPERPTEGIQNADLYVNLGNAALGAERLGPAIAAYRSALAVDPDHHRAVQNLVYARTLLPEWVPRPEDGGFLDSFFSWSRRLSLRELQTLAAGAFLLAAALVAAAIRWRQPACRNLALIPLLAWLVFLSVLAFRETAGDGDVAVITLPEVVARSADSLGAPARLPQPLPSGTEVRVIETREDWTHVRLFDGREAWVPAASLTYASRPCC